MATSGRRQRLAEFSGTVHQFKEHEDKLLAKNVRRLSMVQQITARHLNAEIRKARLQASRKKYISVDSVDEPAWNRTDVDEYIYRKTPSYVMSCHCKDCKKHWHVPTAWSADRKRKAQRQLAWKYYAASPVSSCEKDSGTSSTLLDEIDLSLSFSSLCSGSGLESSVRSENRGRNIKSRNLSKPSDHSRDSWVSAFSHWSHFSHSPRSLSDMEVSHKVSKDPESSMQRRFGSQLTVKPKIKRSGSFGSDKSHPYSIVTFKKKMVVNVEGVKE